MRLGGVRRKPKFGVGASPPVFAIGASVTHKWFRPRGYRHFDAAVGVSFANKACNPLFVSKHSWLPLIHYIKLTKRYKPKTGKTEYKRRPIMFASHRDACILSKYAADIGTLLDDYYKKNGLHTNVIAYRKLGRSNYDFSANAYRFAKSLARCKILCFDITGFFDNLDHTILKDRLKRLLGVTELPSDWYAVFKNVTKSSNVDLPALSANPVFMDRLKADKRQPIATIEEIKRAGIPITKNSKKFGIPQGTPISAVFSNLYLMDVDQFMAAKCEQVGGLYQRYSDDIIVICPTDDAKTIESDLQSTISAHKLKINGDKTERCVFEPGSNGHFQYLGFNVSQQGASIRPSSMARQWRKARRAIRKTKEKGQAAIAHGRATHISTKRLRQRFWPIGARNFSKYARLASDSFESKKIIRQVMRWERMVDQAIRDINK